MRNTAAENKDKQLTKFNDKWSCTQLYDELFQKPIFTLFTTFSKPHIRFKPFHKNVRMTAILHLCTQPNELLQ